MITAAVLLLYLPPQEYFQEKSTSLLTLSGVIESMLEKPPGEPVKLAASSSPPMLPRRMRKLGVPGGVSLLLPYPSPRLGDDEPGNDVRNVSGTRMAGDGGAAADDDGRAIVEAVAIEAVVVVGGAVVAVAGFSGMGLQVW